MAFAFFIQLSDLADVQVLAAKLGGEAANALVLDKLVELDKLFLASD
jgi:hypothetical protein